MQIHGWAEKKFSAEFAEKGRTGRGEESGHFEEVKILTLHGVLHLAGYDHESDNGRMARKESKLRRELGLPTGLIERNRQAGTKGLPVRKTRASSRGAAGSRRPR